MMVMNGCSCFAVDVLWRVVGGGEVSRYESPPTTTATVRSSVRSQPVHCAWYCGLIDGRRPETWWLIAVCCGIGCRCSCTRCRSWLLLPLLLLLSRSIDNPTNDACNTPTAWRCKHYTHILLTHARTHTHKHTNTHARTHTASTRRTRTTRLAGSFFCGNQFLHDLCFSCFCI